MILGFTGTRKGMSKLQKKLLLLVLNGFGATLGQVHHGGCRGADSEFHSYARMLGVHIVIHLPQDHKLQESFVIDQSMSVLPDKPYLQRNRDIVDACDLLIAAPAGDNEILRSGTWATIRYARLREVPVLILPRGKEEVV